VKFQSNRNLEVPLPLVYVEPEVSMPGKTICCFKLFFSCFPPYKTWGKKTSLDHFLLHEPELPSASKCSSILSHQYTLLGFVIYCHQNKAKCPSIWQDQLTSYELKKFSWPNIVSPHLKRHRYSTVQVISLSRQKK